MTNEQVQANLKELFVECKNLARPREHRQPHEVIHVYPEVAVVPYKAATRHWR